MVNSTYLWPTYSNDDKIIWPCMSSMSTVTLLFKFSKNIFFTIHPVQAHENENKEDKSIRGSIHFVNQKDEKTQRK